MRKNLFAAIVAALALGFGFEASAFQAYSIPTGPIAGNQSWTGGLGNDFDVVDPITITSLGAFDDNGDGIAGSIDVHIFDLSNTAAPLASVSISGNGDLLMDNFRFKDITPLTLEPGSYSVVAVGFDGTDRNGNENVADIPFTTDGGGGLITFVDSRFGDQGVDPLVTFPAHLTVGNFPCAGQAEACFAAGSFKFAAAGPENNHYKCYDVDDRTDLEPEPMVSLEDMFSIDVGVEVEKAKVFCNPVDKNGEGIADSENHLTCYKIDSDQSKRTVEIENQFGTQTLVIDDGKLLCVPSAKLAVAKGDLLNDDDDDDKDDD